MDTYDLAAVHKSEKIIAITLGITAASLAGGKQSSTAPQITTKSIVDGTTLKDLLFQPNFIHFPFFGGKGS